jgi:hypothetical protein
LLPNSVLKKTVVHEEVVVMSVLVPVRDLTVQLDVAHVAPPAAMLLQRMEAISPQKPQAIMPITPPLSAFAKSPRQPLQLTAKENNYVATRSSQVSQRAKRP